jgi:DNA-binding CsgD family transcriptional regulator
LVELAIELGGDTTERRIRAGELHFRAGSLELARKHLRSALDEAPPGAMRALALLWFGGVKGYDDDLPGAAEAFSAAADEAGDVPALHVMCLLRLALALALLDRLGEAIEHAERAVHLADELEVPDLQSQARSIWVFGRFLWGMGLDHEALRVAVELEDPTGTATTYFRAGAVEAEISAYLGDLERAEAQMRDVRRRMLDSGTEVDLIYAASRIAAIACWSGRHAEATEAAAEAVQRAEQMGGHLSLAAAWTAQATIAAYAGRESEARASATAAIDTSKAIGARELVKEPTRILGFLEVSLGNFGAAISVLEPLLRGFDAIHDVEIQRGSHLPNAIEALTAVGRIDDAEPLVDALERAGTGRRRPWVSAAAARGRSQILAARGELPGAIESAERAVEHHELLPMPFEQARTQLLLGQLYRRRRQGVAAAGALRSALDAFERLGTPLWAAKARAELTRVNAGRGGEQQLTAAELRIANLAVAGLTNKDIAAELYLSGKTVEAHLSRVYRKLGIRSRMSLGPALRSVSGGADQS